FFSSRRRHTRLQGDWSSDVCSSDLVANGKHYLTRKIMFPVRDVNEILFAALCKSVDTCAKFPPTSRATNPDTKLVCGCPADPGIRLRVRVLTFPPSSCQYLVS